MDQFKRYDLLDNSRAVERALVGAVVVVFLGLVIPQTMFWGKYNRLYYNVSIPSGR